jgi:hypothetical protein
MKRKPVSPGTQTSRFIDPGPIFDELYREGLRELEARFGEPRTAAERASLAWQKQKLRHRIYGQLRWLAHW